MASQSGHCGNSPDTPADDASSEDGGTDWPTKSINMIVPMGAGGDTDFNARTYAKYLEDVLGETVVVTNITGNGGALGSEEVKNASPDGYTCLFYHTCLNINQATGIADYGSEAFETVAVVGKSSGEAVVVRTDAMYDELKAAPTAPGFREIMIPGEIEFHLTRQAEREGIDISPAIEQDFADLAVRYGVPLELLQSCWLSSGIGCPPAPAGRGTHRQEE